ncbi:G10 protein (macronuclear) [Tetrahymena thermophila SB210]|uniref:G10 protein n=1 Tax=Tetrahymena thermophila (strain SB210) TaxID=312017 RepID=Q22X71_TETTS|nr:G10 protein [Tetrahymena thermophila SB210]EAR89775.3 G10 protein [Tetrahymena thermophila SB210]|eukprot:XP_001010020.3 G10 protein [Tetrahymena thermophila SB210]
MTSRNPLFISKSFFEIIPPEQEVRNGIYEGQLVQNKRQGKGIFIWDDSSVYVGDWLNDQPHGEGILFLNHGCYAFGSFEGGKLNGKAMVKFANESRIFGQWRQNQLRGICFFYDHEKREWKMCEFKQGVLFRILEIQENSPMGQQSQFFSASSPYNYILNTDIPIPLFPQFSRRDFELFSLSSILQRITNISQNTIIGQKQLAFINLGEELNYFGLIQNGIPEGLGVTLSGDILKNIGTFKQSIMQGIGRIYSENGLIFDGNFEKGHLSGLGYLYNSETNIFYEGLFYENECNKLFKKSKGFQIETIIKQRQNQHKQGCCFRNQILVLEICQILNGQMPLLNLFRNSKSFNTEEVQSIVQADNNPIYSFIQANKEYIENKRHNCFFYPNQIVNRQLFNTSSLSSHQGLQINSYPYEEYEFSLHEFQRQLEKPRLSTIMAENQKFEEKINNPQNNFSNTSTNSILNLRSNIYLRQQKNYSSPGQNRNLQSAINSNQMNTKTSSPLEKTPESYVSYFNDLQAQTPQRKTPLQKKYSIENSSLEKKQMFSNTQGSNHNSVSQFSQKNPYFQIIPQNQENIESQRNSSLKKNQNQNSSDKNYENPMKLQNPFYNTKTTKKQGNWLYEQIRARSNTPNLRYNDDRNNISNNNTINIHSIDTVVERNMSNNQSQNLSQSYIQNNSLNSFNNQKNGFYQKNNHQPNIQMKNQQYSSIQNPFKSQINVTHNTSYSSINQNNNLNETKNQMSNQYIPKSKIFNRPKSSLNQMTQNMQQQQISQRELAQPIRFQTTNESISKRSISPFQSYNTSYNQQQNNRSRSTSKQVSPLRTKQKSNNNFSPIVQNIYRKNSSSQNKLFQQQTTQQRDSKDLTNQNSFIQKNKKMQQKKQKENIKQVHLRLPSSFFK